MKYEFYLVCPNECGGIVTEIPPTPIEHGYCKCDCGWEGTAEECTIEEMGYEQHGAKYEAGRI